MIGASSAHNSLKTERGSLKAARYSRERYLDVTCVRLLLPPWFEHSLDTAVLLCSPPALLDSYRRSFCRHYQAEGTIGFR